MTKKMTQNIRKDHKNGESNKFQQNPVLIFKYLDIYMFLNADNILWLMKCPLSWPQSPVANLLFAVYKMPMFHTAIAFSGRQKVNI